MMKHHELVGANVLIEYTDNSKGSVRCTLSNDKISVFQNDLYVDKDIVNFLIMKQNLIDKDLAIKGFKYITYNRDKYEVTDVTVSSTLDNTILLRCTKIG